MNKRQEKILGSLLGAAMGDALGALTETYTTDLILEYFGGYVTDFVPPPPDGLSRGTKEGTVTDDFSIPYYTLEEIIKADAPMSEEIAIKALIEWEKHPEYTRYAGPTTRARLAELTGNPPVRPIRNLEFLKWVLCNNFTSSNGAGMKAGIAGLLNPGDLDAAIDDAIIMCMPTHDNTIALSGGCAIAAATAAAMRDHVSWPEVIEAGMYGAQQGYEKALKIARPAAGPSVEKRTRLAVQMGLERRGNFDKAMRDIADLVGGGLYAYESIPAVFGYIAACSGDAMDSILMGVNAGDDTDTIACMTGFIVGALHGVSAFPHKHIATINRENNFDLEQMAVQIDAYLTKREVAHNE